MTRQEYSDNEQVWVLPPERVKNGRTHLVPLSDMALRIIRAQLRDNEALARRKGRDVPDFIFPGPGARAAIRGDAVAKAIKRMEVTKRGVTTIMGIAPWTCHDLRRTAATRMEEVKILPFVISHILNHASETKNTVTKRHYAHYDYFPEKQEALDTWAERLSAVIEGSAAKILRHPGRKAA